MMYLQKSFTVPAAPAKITACERCVYGSGPHASFCPLNDEWAFIGHGSGPLPGRNAKIEWPINGRARWILE